MGAELQRRERSGRGLRALLERREPRPEHVQSTPGRGAPGAEAAPLSAEPPAGGAVYLGARLEAPRVRPPARPGLLEPRTAPPCTQPAALLAAALGWGAPAWVRRRGWAAVRRPQPTLPSPLPLPDEKLRDRLEAQQALLAETLLPPGAALG